ncbi:conserved hypothetical protein [Ricinus communis]|uniref:Uncharacterized protein n=1 Tax=Ricinus communis TaxID=3988 RepID=B9RXF2_RICCO|nr:conserved hypothetical protein [Ricinus communis]
MAQGIENSKQVSEFSRLNLRLPLVKACDCLEETGGVVFRLFCSWSIMSQAQSFRSGPGHTCLFRFTPPM